MDLADALLVDLGLALLRELDRIEHAKADLLIGGDVHGGHELRIRVARAVKLRRFLSGGLHEHVVPRTEPARGLRNERVETRPVLQCCEGQVRDHLVVDVHVERCCRRRRGCRCRLRSGSRVILLAAASECQRDDKPTAHACKLHVAVDKVQQEVVPILVLVAAIAFVVRRLPRVEVTHSDEFRRRRVLNWLPLGLTYAFLYMGRYNFNGLVDGHLISKVDFGDIDGVGQIVYGLAFLVNGPLTDRFGGRFAILLAAAGAGLCNGIIGISIAVGGHAPSFSTLMILNALNMYFQSFGAVAIVKVNASWFHLRERGTFGGIFGILISLGIYLAFDWAPKIASLTSLEWLFLTPAVLLAAFFFLDWSFVRDTPGKAGLADFDVADASSGQSGPPDKALVIIKRMLTSRIIMTIALIALCSGFARMGVLKWVKAFGGSVGLKDTFGYQHWGMLSCIAGITGGMFAGVISDHVFQSRRPPVATVLFGIALIGLGVMIAVLSFPAAIFYVSAFILMAILGIHGMLSGVASQDFGGSRNAGTATGMIDGFVYFGGAFQAFVYGNILPTGHDAASASNWHVWPLAMIPLAVIGLGLSLSVYKAVVQNKTSH